MLFMVIERFRNRDAKAVYRRFREQGRMLPLGLKYIESWTEANFERCFQLMECEDPQLFNEWMSRWQDLVEFEIIPVVSSQEAANSMTQML
jgi:succinate dehydrogenase flavin-adding protein (antitoxin of CptAB toxin-antitoxin module)